MKNAPAFQLYAADFYMDTASWTATQVGAYFRLLLHEWINGPLPDDMVALARIAGVDRKTMIHLWSSCVGKKFSLNESGAWENSRLEKTRAKQEEYRKARILGGNMTATKRWGEKKNNSSAISSAYSSGVALHSSSSSSNNNTPLTPRKRGDEYDADFLKFWNAYPKKAKKPNACREWRKLGSKRPDVDHLLRCIAKQKAWRQWREGFIPDPERWLKGERWNDEEPPNTGGNNGNGNRRTYPNTYRRGTERDTELPPDVQRTIDEINRRSREQAAAKAEADATNGRDRAVDPGA